MFVVFLMFFCFVFVLFLIFDVLDCIFDYFCDVWYGWLCCCFVFL